MNIQEEIDGLLAEDVIPDCTPLGALLALVAVGKFDLAERLLNSMLDKGLNVDDIHEILLQSHLFAGFPRAIRGLQLLEDLRLKKGSTRSDRTDADRTDAGMPRMDRGITLFKQVYGSRTDAVLESLRSLHPEYDRWILEDAYGRVLSRPFLPGKTRELCAVAALTVSGVPRQLQSHILGAYNLGASSREIKGIIQHMTFIHNGKKVDDALEILVQLNLK